MRLPVTLTALALFALAPAARADAVLVAIDGTDPKVKPADFGYTVRTVTVGQKVVISVEMSPTAAKAFGVGELRLTKGDRTVVETTVAITKDGRGNGTLKLTVDPRAIDGGELVLWSAHFDGAPLVPNFGGFRLSVKALLDRAKDER